MTCARLEVLLALRAEGDLSQDEARRVDAHLAACPACRDLAASYERSQRFLRSQGPAPFGEPDYAAIRRAVGEQIAKEAIRGRRFVEAPGFFEGKKGGAGLVAAGVLLIALIAALSWGGRQPVPSDAALLPSQKNSAPTAAVESATHSGESAALLPSQKKAAQGVAAGPDMRKGAGSSRPSAKTVPVRMAVSRIELQTINPNVRVIWLAGGTPASPRPETDTPNGS